jgi:simple sugar transport system permease protein
VIGMDAWTAILITIITAATPLLLAAIGELVVERSGVLNLGVEGMMVMGAVSGFGVAFLSGNPYLGVIAAILAGIAMALLFGFLTLTLVSNQVATGLSLTLLGLGLSGLLGESFVGEPGARLRKYLGIDMLIPFSFILTAVVPMCCSAPRPASSSAPWATATIRRMPWATVSSACVIFA